MASQQRLRILLVGNGGREHAIAWRLAQCHSVEKVFVVPGNGGTAIASPKVVNIDDIAPDNYSKLVALAQTEGVGLVVPGPDVPIVDGIEGYFRAAHIPCFAPCKATAQIEGSKAFAKGFMQRHGIPTARYKTFSDYHLACEHVRSIDYDVVIKASGLAAGKGVIIPENTAEALEALAEIMVQKSLGDSGDEVVVEELLRGYEISILTFCDGQNFKSLPPAQDHNRIFDGDKGPNTGGMGCYAPVDVADAKLLADIDDTVLAPTFCGLSEEAEPFIGCLFTGFMITDSGPRVLEYNARFGDPETQALLPLLDSDTDLAEVMLACTQGNLPSARVSVRSGYSVAVILASNGYPGAYQTNKLITIKEGGHVPREEATLFHAGTREIDGSLYTAGGRVMAVQALGDSLQEALDTAYAAVQEISFEGKHFRKDIAHRAKVKPT
ncbi:hypothetical protein BFW01_g1679 [Lasiodiplodia theobromae]|nr:hypothetical protein BFW01_g1679 [Lasiodiplodia theobromae]